MALESFITRGANYKSKLSLRSRKTTTIASVVILRAEHTAKLSAITLTNNSRPRSPLPTA